LRAFVGSPHEAIARDGVRFLIAGSLSSAVNWLVRLGFSFVVPFPAALAIGAAIGMAVAFVLYRSWVFPSSARRLRAQTVLFLLVCAVTASFVIAASLVFVRLMTDIPLSDRNRENLAHALAIGCGAIISFLGHRTFTFAHRPG
jgi:putative flippase GtrA